MKTFILRLDDNTMSNVKIFDRVYLLLPDKIPTQ